MSRETGIGRGQKTSQARTYVFRTQWGWCGIGASERGVSRVVVPDGYQRKELRRMLGGRTADTPPASAKSLCEYFAGRKTAFRVSLDLSGCTDFEKIVYKAVGEIPYGRTASYGEIARRVGRPRAARAVGATLARNPVPIFIPCHRVVRADGMLGGFSSRGGAATKLKLLALERERT